MKKSYLLVAICTALFLTGCGVNDAAEDAADTVIDMHDNVDEASEALGDYKEEINSVDENAAEILGEDSKAEDAAASNGYVFEYNGTKMCVDEKADAVIAALGEPAHYYEVKSCAFEGMDKIYTYNSFEISTYPQNDADYISYITLKDDTVSTKEGAYLSMSLQEIQAIYGSNCTEENGVYTYEQNGALLQFIFKDDQAVSIEYASKVLDE